MKRISLLMLVLSFLFISCNSKWEYKTVKVFTSEINERTGTSGMKTSSIDISDSTLNQYGEDGWELVNTYLEMETAFPNFGNGEYVTGLRENVRPQLLVLIFKKKL
jgi:hypothetical protein